VRAAASFILVGMKSVFFVEEKGLKSKKDIMGALTGKRR
jgi:hypothetical protein